MGASCRTTADVKQDETITTLNKQLDQLQKSRADSSVNVDDVRAELLTLRGKIEENSHRQQQSQAQSEKLLAAMDERLRLMEEKVGKRLDQMEAASQRLAQERASERNQERQSEKPKTASTKARAEEATPATYTKGVAAFEGGDYKAAIKFLEAFLDSKPKGSKASGATYLLAQSHHKLKDHARAIDLYQSLRDHYPNYSRVPEVILLQAQAFQEMGEKETSKLFYTEVIDKFPQSVQAKVARKALSKLK